MVLVSGSYDEKQTRKGGFSSNRDAIEKMSEKVSLCLDFFSFLLRATVGQLYWQDMSCNYCLSPDERVRLPPGRTQCEDRPTSGDGDDDGDGDGADGDGDGDGDGDDKICRFLGNKSTYLVV